MAFTSTGSTLLLTMLTIITTLGSLISYKSARSNFGELSIGFEELTNLFTLSILIAMFTSSGINPVSSKNKVVSSFATATPIKSPVSENIGPPLFPLFNLEVN